MILFLLVAALSDPTPRELARAAVAATNEMRLDDAQRDAEKAMSLAITCNDAAGRALAADALAIVYRMRGDAEQALGFADEAVLVAEQSADAEAQARAHTGLGRIYQDLLNRDDLARVEYERTLAFEKQVEDKTIVARALINIGNMERSRRALPYYERARRIAIATKDRYGIAASEHNLALVYLSQHDAEKALPHLRRALAADTAYASRSLLSMSEAYRELGRRDSAALYLRRARNSAKDDVTRAYILLREADLSMERGDYASAQRTLDDSRKISDDAALPLVDAYRAKLAFRRGDFSSAAALATAASHAAREPDIASQAAAIAGSALRRTGDIDGAKRMLLSSIQAIESRRRTVPRDDFSRGRFFERELFPYEQLVAIAAAENNAKDALRFAELQKARLLSDAIGPVPQAGRTPDADESFIEYALAADDVIAIVIDRERQRVLTLPVARSEAAQLATSFGQMLSSRNENFRESARRLYDVLWKPLGIATPRVRIVPHGELWRVAFPALVDEEGRFLITTRTISYAPSLTLSHKPAADGDLILAAANLPGETTEIEALRSIYGDRVTLAPRATEGEVKRLAPLYAVVHFAAHGSYVEDDPLDSFLTFGEDATNDGRLTARELMSMSLQARLVVISACSSAAGSIAPGEGIIGMTWALLIAGAPTVVAAQWEVESQVTTGVMRSFHERLSRGASPADALRTAQLEMLTQLRGGHPFYWAAFVVIDAGP